MLANPSRRGHTLRPPRFHITGRSLRFSDHSSNDDKTGSIARSISPQRDLYLVKHPMSATQRRVSLRPALPVPAVKPNYGFPRVPTLVRYCAVGDRDADRPLPFSDYKIYCIPFEFCSATPSVSNSRMPLSSSYLIRAGHLYTSKAPSHQPRYPSQHVQTNSLHNPHAPPGRNLTRNRNGNLTLTHRNDRPKPPCRRAPSHQGASPRFSRRIPLHLVLPYRSRPVPAREHDVGESDVYVLFPRSAEWAADALLCAAGVGYQGEVDVRGEFAWRADCAGGVGVGCAVARALVERGCGCALPSIILWVVLTWQMRCNIMMGTFVKKTLKKAHSALVGRLLVKSQIQEAAFKNQALNDQTAHTSFAGSSTSTEYNPSDYDAQSQSSPSHPPDSYTNPQSPPMYTTHNASSSSQPDNRSSYDNRLYPAGLNIRNSGHSHTGSTASLNDQKVRVQDPAAGGNHPSSRVSWQNLNPVKSPSMDQNMAAQRDSRGGTATPQEYYAELPTDGRNGEGTGKAPERPGKYAELE